MKFLQISILLLSLTSCTLATTKNLVSSPVVNTHFDNPYFSDSNQDYVYKGKIDVYGNYFGGIFIVKKIGRLHHRIVLTTELGNKIFDFELQNDSYKVNYILEELDRKIIINTLKRDFQLLVKEHTIVKKKYKNDPYIIYQSQHKKQLNFYFINKDTGKLEKLVNTSKRKEKTIVNFESINKKLAQRIVIEHKNIKLKIELKYLDNN